jgi:hypothetical protein
MVKNTTLIFLVFLWVILVGGLAFRGFFLNLNAVPPRFLLVIVPGIAAVLVGTFSKKGIEFSKSLGLRPLVMLSVVRVPVELVLYWLFLNKAVPRLMTFEGRNFDILAGLSAPVIYFYCFKGANLVRKTVLLVWNFISLGLLMNIMTIAFLSVPFRFERFAFDQPNVAVLYFPYAWLPSFIVMIVLYSHLILLRKLMSSKQANP